MAVGPSLVAVAMGKGMLRPAAAMQRDDWSAIPTVWYWLYCGLEVVLQEGHILIWKRNGRDHFLRAHCSVVALGIA